MVDMLGPGAWPDVSQAPLGRGWRGGVPTKGRLGRRRRSWSSRPSRTLIMQRHLAARNAKVRISRGGPTKGTMVQRSLMLRSACSAPRGEKLNSRPHSPRAGADAPTRSSVPPTLVHVSTAPECASGRCGSSGATRGASEASILLEGARPEISSHFARFSEHDGPRLLSSDAACVERTPRGVSYQKGAPAEDPEPFRQPPARSAKNAERL